MRQHILIIEDNPIQQKLYRLLCGRFGFDATMFACAGEACDYLQQVEDMPQLVLLDCLLKQGENGLASVTRLKEIGAKRNRPLKVVAVTANAFDTDKQACLESGVDDYLAKPFTLEQFSQLLERWADAHSQSGVA